MGGISNTLGLRDYRDYRDEYKGKLNPYNKAEAGKRFLWNGSLINSNELIDDAIQSDIAGVRDPDFPRIKSEICNLQRLLKELTAPHLWYSNSTSNMTLKQETVRFNDENYDWRKQPWEKDLFLLNNGRPDYTFQNVIQKKEESVVGYKHPCFRLFLGLEGSFAVTIKQDDYKGTMDSRFRLYPYIDPLHPENTPDHLLNLYGSEYTAGKFGPVQSQSADFKASLPMFEIWKDLPFFSQVFTKPSIGYKNTLTEMGIKANYNFRYNEITGKMEPDSQEGLFVSDRHDLTFGLESRTLPIFEWPGSIYPAFTLECKNSVLNKNMSSIYELSARNYDVPTYYKDVKLTDAQRETIRKDYYENYLPNILRQTEPLTANDVSLGFRMNIPGMMQLLRGVGIVDEFGFAPGSDFPIKTSYKATWSNNDYIRNTDNGLYPAYRDYFAEYYLNDSGDLVKNGADLHEKMSPYNGSSHNISIEHKLRLGDLCRIKSGWDKVYVGDKTWKNDWLGMVGLYLWYIPSLAWPLIRYPVSLVDDGFNKTTPVYMPMEFSWGWGSYNVGGDWKNSSEGSFTIGVGIRDNLVLKYRTFWSDNGYNYKENGQNLSLTWMFQ